MSSPYSGTPARLLVPAILCLLLVLPARAQVAAAVRAFDEGNGRYVAGEYAEAVAAYETALAAGFASGALYFNMGNAYYRLDQVGQAIRYYEKARRVMPDQAELQHNLAIAQARTVDRFSQLPTPFWTRWWHGLVRVAGAGGLFALGLVLYLAAAVLVAQRIRTGTRNAWHRRALSLSLLCGLVLLTAAFGASLERTLLRQAVVVTDVTPLRATPAPGADALLELHEGLVLDVLQDDGAWVEVRLPNGTAGWLSGDVLAEI